MNHGGGSFWTPVSVDRAANVVYVPVGNPAPDFFGDVRKGANLYTNSAAALDLASGKPLWTKPTYSRAIMLERWAARASASFSWRLWRGKYQELSCWVRRRNDRLRPLACQRRHAS